MFLVGIGVASGNAIKNSVHREVTFNYFWRMCMFSRHKNFQLTVFLHHPRQQDPILIVVMTV